ncbi:hypothetical protein [Lapidilactobacillus luobeiensis]|uniref:hypothetical protein n=1 Tax=Lapidilactobacillus luobeiensis TaxID=2950371 RepID=UPI0021C2F232|nr:hypothetical protein [Lapidilactobacillus luobeiensis]
MATVKQFVEQQLDRLGKILFTGLLILAGFVTIVGGGLGLILAQRYTSDRQDWWSGVWQWSLIKKALILTLFGWLWILAILFNFQMVPQMVGVGGVLHLSGTILIAWLGGMWLLWSQHRLALRGSTGWLGHKRHLQEVCALGGPLSGLLVIDLGCFLVMWCFPATALLLVGLVFTWQERFLKRLGTRFQDKMGE